MIEMLVVLFIITLITAIVITGQSGYNKTLLLTDTTYGVALSAREAQSFGLASRKYGNVQNPGYGLHFDTVSSRYILFADTNSTLTAPSTCPNASFNATLPSGSPLMKPGNCRYDNGNADGIMSTNTFTRGFLIKRFCGKDLNNVVTCSTYNPALTSLDLVFTRPNTTTVISGLINGSLTPFSCAQIMIQDATGQANREIRIYSTGQISMITTNPMDIKCP